MLKIEDTEFYCFESHEDIIKNYIVSYLVLEKKQELNHCDFGDFSVFDNHVHLHDIEEDIYIPGLKQLQKFLTEHSFEFDTFSKEVFDLKISRFLNGWWVYFISDVFSNQLSFKSEAMKKYYGVFEAWYNRKGNVIVKTNPSQIEKFGYVSYSIDRLIFDLDLGRHDNNNHEYFPDPDDKDSQTQHRRIRLIPNTKFEQINKNDYEFCLTTKFIFYPYD